MINGNRTKSNRGRSPRDFYETPIELARAAIFALHNSEPCAYEERWLDAGCGTGIWGKALDNNIRNVHGIDLEPKVGINQNGIYYNSIMTGDFLKYDDVYGLDVIFGNPPYSLAEEFVRHAYTLIGLNDYIFFLLRLSFLGSIKRGCGLFKDIPLKRLYVCSRRPSFFSSKGKSHTTDSMEYAMFLWQKGYRGQPIISFLDWEYEHGK